MIEQSMSVLLRCTGPAMHVMSQPGGHRYGNLWAIVSLFIVTLVCSVPIGFAAESAAPSASVQEEKTQPAETGEIQERGLKKDAPGQVKKAPNQPEGGLPANLCHQVMTTECRCFNSTDCQVLSALFPAACPVGSQSCQFIPMFRKTPLPLPPNLCGYQVPGLTQCSCSNVADCQVLSTLCPGSCPVGSQSCQCTPMQRR